MSGGRPSSVPPRDYKAPQRLVIDDERCEVHFVATQDSSSRVFDFTVLPVARPLQEAFARAFAVHTGPSGDVGSIGGANGTWRTLRQFAEVLHDDERPPAAPGDLRSRHLDAFRLKRAHLVSIGMVVGVLRSLLVNIPGLTPDFAARCAESVPGRRDEMGTRASYVIGDEQAILKTCRETLRKAARRIRENREFLQDWRDGKVDPAQEPGRYELGQVLDLVDTVGELPRHRNGSPLPSVSRHGSVADLTLALHISRAEACAFTMLLVRLTGQNGGTIANAPAAHHRPDGHASRGIPTVQIDLSKPRRGARRYMTATLENLPRWAEGGAPEVIVSGYDQLHTPFGVYMLAWELTASTRRIVGDGRLLAYWIPKGGRARSESADGSVRQMGRCFKSGLSKNAVAEWGAEHGLTSIEVDADGVLRPLVFSVGRMRQTFVAAEDKPVAHSEQTMRDIYQRRDRTSVIEYQKLVSEVLAKETQKAKQVGSVAMITLEDLTEAEEAPAVVAGRLGVSLDALRVLISRDGDTVLAGCADNLNSPFSERGKPCRASFLKCLDCGCARAMPHHLPVQLAAREVLDEMRVQVTALRWAERFAAPAAQLDDLFVQVGKKAVDRARLLVTEDDRELVRRLLNREFDY